jgi:hypothetical protein
VRAATSAFNWKRLVNESVADRISLLDCMQEDFLAQLR